MEEEKTWTVVQINDDWSRAGNYGKWTVHTKEFSYIHKWLVCMITHNINLFSYVLYFSIIKRLCLKKKQVYEEIKTIDKRSTLIRDLT